MSRCCTNPFITQIWGGPPLGPPDPAASLCYHYEDVDLGQFDLVTNLVIDKVTIDGVDTVINKTVIFGDWGFDYLSFNYAQVVSDLAGFATTAGVEGMGFFIALTDGGNLGFRFAMVADGAISHTLTYSVDTGSGLTPVTVDLTGQNCGLSYQCFEAEYTPANPFLIDFGRVVAVTNTDLTLFETQFFGPMCTEFEDDPAYLDAFIPYVQTLHGTQASASIVVNGNTATVTILNTLLVPAHMDNTADSGCMEPSTPVTQNNFTLIDCP